MSEKPRERRVRRSRNLQEALGYWLEATRLRTRLSSIALADTQGMLVAGAGPASECDELAAWAPIVLENVDFPSAPPFVLQGERVNGFDAYVCTGSSGAAPELLADTARGCSRILSGP